MPETPDQWDKASRWARLVATDGDQGGNPPTMPTPDPAISERTDESDPIDLRFDLEELLVKLDLSDGTEIGRIDEEDRFQIRELLGRGAMGAVYRAYDRQLGRDVALKVVSHTAMRAAEPRNDQRFERDEQDRLLKEARALAQMKHRNVLRVHDVRVALSGERVIALEFINGPTLREWQEERSLDELLDAYLDAATGLAAAHDAGVVHRDFKPDNALFNEEDQSVVVVDFGLAGGVIADERQRAGPLSPIESTGLGTPDYMAPEQHHRPADASCDQYSFCVALWEAIDGRRPFGRERGPNDEIPSAPQKMPAWVYRVLRPGLAFEPKDRHADMHALIGALEKGRRLARFKRRIAVLVAIVAIIVGLAIVLQPPPCADATAPLEKVWNEDARARIKTAFARLDTDWGRAAGPHALDTLDAVAGVWSREAARVCEAKLDEGTTPALDRRSACLENWLEQIHTTVELLEGGGGRMADGLPGALDQLIQTQDLCRLPPPLLTAPLRRLLVNIQVSEGLRDLDAALEMSEQALELAELEPRCVDGSDRSFGDAAAHFRRGHVLGLLERWDEAELALREASRHAHGCNDPWTLFDIRAFEAYIHSRDDNLALDVAARTLADAEALLLPTVGPDPVSLRAAELHRMNGLVAAAGPSPDYDRALAAFVRSRELLEQLDVQPLARKVALLHNIGSTSQRAGRSAEAEAAYAEAIELLTEELGSDQHPQILRTRAIIDVNRALAALETEQFDDAARLFERAALHGNVPEAARAWGGWVQARLGVGDLAEALILARRFEGWLGEHGDELPDSVRAEALTNLGQGLMDGSLSSTGGSIVDAEAFDAGLELALRSRDLWERTKPEQVPLVLYNIAAALHDGGRLDEAEVLLRELRARDLPETVEEAISPLEDSISSQR